MRKFSVLLLVFIVAISANAQNFNSYVVRLKNSKNIDKLQSKNISVKKVFSNLKQIKSQPTLQSSSLVNRLNTYAVISNIGNLSDTEFKNLLANYSEFVQPNYIYTLDIDESIPNDKKYKEQWNIKQIKADKVWNKATGKGIKVGVIDTGIDFEHIELEGQLYISEQEDINKNGKFDPWSIQEEKNGITGDLDGIDNDNNGYIDDVIGYDFVDEDVFAYGDYADPDPIPADEHSHGTYVSGIIAAKNNNEEGITGIAYDAKIVTVRAFDMAGQGESDDIANAIVYLTLQGVKVINCSFGEHYDTEILKDACDFATANGVILIASSGNNNHFLPHYPSEYSNVISVGGTNNKLGKYGYGNYGSRLDICAPGQEVLSLDLNNKYAVKSGTSASAPHITAAVALLIEKFGDMDFNVIKNKLLTTGFDIGKPGWDSIFAAGVLDLEQALDYTGMGAITVTFPQNERNLYKEFTPKVKIEGSIINSLFEKYDVEIGAGILPEKWEHLATSTEQVKNSTIAEIDISEMKDTVYTCKIKVNLKNGKTLEHRFYFNVYSNNTLMSFKNYGAINIFKNGKRNLLFYAQTSMKSLLDVSFYNEEGKIDRKIKDRLYLDDFHEVLVDDVEENKEYEVRFTAQTNNYHSSMTPTMKVLLQGDSFKNDEFQLKNTIDNRLFLNKYDFELNNKKYFIFNDFKNLDINHAILYEVDNKNNISAVDTADNGYIVKSVGDINNDGKQDIMTILYSETKIYSFDEKGKLFSNELFASDPMYNFIGEHLVDLDNDGQSELISTDTKSFQMYGFKNNELQVLDSLIIPGRHRSQGVWVNSKIGDFDGDGKRELCFVNNVGALFIYEIENKKFTFEYADTTSSDLSRHYLSVGDYDGDGNQEIAHLSYNTSDVMGYKDGVNPIWVCKVIGYDNNKYEKVWEDYFHGVRHGTIRRTGFQYQNGLASGDLNSDNKDELVISVFPNLYVFSDISNKEADKSMWYFPAALSNTAYIGDIDNNGQNELVFSSFNNTLIYELPTKPERPATPTNLSAYVYSDSMCVLKWNKSKLSNYYNIGVVNAEKTEVNVLDFKIEGDSIRLGKFDTPNVNFAVCGVNDTLKETKSLFSEIVEVYYHNPIDTFYIESINNAPLSFNVKFNGELTAENMNNYDFILYRDNSLMTYASSIMMAGDSSVIISFSEKFSANDYVLTAEPFKDKYGTFSKGISVPFTLEDNNEKAELFITNLKVYSSHLLEIFYSEPVIDSLATNIKNYSISPNGNVESVSKSNNANAYTIFVDNLFPNTLPVGDTYTLSVDNLLAESGNELTKGAGRTISFLMSTKNNSTAFAYPQPLSLQKEEYLKFGGLTNNATIEIMTLSGEKVITLKEADGNGGTRWNLLNKNGEKIEYGLYLYRITGVNKSGESVDEELKKIVILP
jgi:subtilisin family serine protease